MIGREEILASTNKHERDIILDQQESKSEYNRYSNKFYKGQDTKEYWDVIGRLYGQKYRAEMEDNKNWELIENHFSLYQRRIILEVGDITEEDFPLNNPSTSMITEKEIQESLTPEEYQLVLEMETSQFNQDELASKLNDAIETRQPAQTIGECQLKFLNAEDKATKASDTLFKTLKRFKYRVLIIYPGYWTKLDWNRGAPNAI